MVFLRAGGTGLALAIPLGPPVRNNSSRVSAAIENTSFTGDLDNAMFFPRAISFFTLASGQGGLRGGFPACVDPDKALGH